MKCLPNPNTGGITHEIQKRYFFLLLVLLFTAACCLEFPLLLLEMKVFGFGKPGGWTIGHNLLHWFLTSLIWGMISASVLLLTKNKYLDNDQKRPPSQLPYLRLLFIFCIAAVGIFYMSSTWDFRFKPAVEWQNMNVRFGNAGIWTFCFQYLYYMSESMVITVITVFGQRAGESLFPFKASVYIPWGGICCAMTWGILHFFSKGWSTAVSCIFLSLLFGIAHISAGKKLRYTYPLVALIFLL